MNTHALQLPAAPVSTIKQFIGILRYEYKMSTRRPGLWIAFIFLYLFYGITLFSPSSDPLVIPTGDEMWRLTGQLAFMFNLFMPVIAGIIAADRVVRDRRLGVDELLDSTPLKRWTYILGKYTGVTLSVLTPVFAFYAFILIVMLATGFPVQFGLIALLGFLAIIVPAYLFVVAFSLTCPVVIPLRVYQVLFTGYWFWGNYLNPEAFPSLSNTHLVPSGKVAMLAWFRGGSLQTTNYDFSTTPDAIISLSLLALFAAAALFALERYKAYHAARA
jgi:hypothetical protein